MCASVGSPGGSDGKESAYSAGDLASIPGLGRSPGGNGNPLQYSCLEIPTEDTGSPWVHKGSDMAEHFTFSSEAHFVRTLHHDPSVLGGPTWHGS